jgi:vitamin B12 transporter
LALPFLCIAQKHDTLHVVKVNAVKEKSIATTPTPLQQLNATQLSRLNSISVADAVKQFAGVQVKDYGGIGGLKTVSVRSLGANHTAVLYDGIAIGNAQGGQIDLGKFSLDNIEQIQLSISNPADLLMPARAFATATLLNIKSSSSILNKAEKQSIKLKLQYGSFGYFAPSFLYKTRIGNKFQTSINALYQTATSQYPYRSYENNQQTEKRTNSDIKAYRFEYDAGYFINDSNKIKFKTYYYNSKRGLPGFVVLYNNTSSQRLDDVNFFAQASWQNKISKRSELLFNAKFSTDKYFYLDPVYLNSAGKLENDFRQKEIYFSVAYKYKLMRYVELYHALDGYQSTLNRKDTFAIKFANPIRNTMLHNIAVQIKKDRFEITGNVLRTTVNEKVTNGKAGRNLNEVTPAIAASVQPFEQVPIRIRAFYKNIFRAPTFDDLYFTNIGNTDLKPEFAKQYNIGITIETGINKIIPNIIFTGDAYVNDVRDKIIAVPGFNLFQWSTENRALVKIKGIDATLQLHFKEYKAIKVFSNISYTFQQALDLSDPTSTQYKTQLPYTPIHSGSANINVAYKKAVLSYNILASSYRYRRGDAIPENLLQGWSSHDLSFAYTLKENYKIIAEANNILNTQYEIIRYYPMPRFNYRISFITNFKK